MARLRLALMIAAASGVVQAQTVKPPPAQRSVGAESLGVETTPDIPPPPVKPAPASPAPVRPTPRPPTPAPAMTPAATPKPVAPKSPAPKSGPFDARDPASMIAFLRTSGATAQLASSKADKVALAVKTPGGTFAAQFVECDAQGKTCKAVAFTSTFERKAGVADINAFNRTQVLCRGYLGEDGRPNVAYSTLVNLRMTSDEMRLHVGAWQGCLASFGEFTRDPIGYLARNR